jgi:lysophospholipase L1-like esterase
VPLIALAKSGPAKAGLYYARYSKLFDELFRNLQAQGQLSYFSTYKVFCSNNELCRFREQDTYFFWDNGHMTHGGADRVINRLAAELPPTVLSALPK